MKRLSYKKAASYGAFSAIALLCFFGIAFSVVSAQEASTTQNDVVVSQEIEGTVALLSQQVNTTLWSLIEMLQQRLDVLQVSVSSGGGTGSTPPPSGGTTSGNLQSLENNGDGTVTATVVGSSCGRTWRIFWGDQTVTRITEPGSGTSSGACPQDAVSLEATRAYTDNGQYTVRVRQAGDSTVEGQGTVRVTNTSTPNVPGMPPSSADRDGILSLVDHGDGRVTAYVSGEVCGTVYWIHWGDGTQTRVLEDDRTSNGVCPTMARTYVAHHTYQESDRYQVTLRSGGEVLSRLSVTID